MVQLHLGFNVTVGFLIILFSFVAGGDNFG